METFEYTPIGVCSSKMIFKIEGDKWTPELKNICLKCLNFNPIARPTAKEIVDLLNNI